MVHIESFRNIDIWYQGAYLLLVQIYAEPPPGTEPVNKVRLYRIKESLCASFCLYGTLYSNVG